MKNTRFDGTTAAVQMNQSHYQISESGSISITDEEWNNITGSLKKNQRDNIEVLLQQIKHLNEKLIIIQERFSRY